jgi:transposase
MRIHLTDEQRREIERVSQQAGGRVALRAPMVLLAGRGYRVPQIARIHDCGEDVVRQWLHRSQDQGVVGLEDAPRRGRPPKDRLAAQIVDTQAGQSPECSGYVHSGWTVSLLTAFLATRFGLLLARASVRRDRHRRGWRWARPRLAPPRSAGPPRWRRSGGRPWRSRGRRPRRRAPS